MVVPNLRHYDSWCLNQGTTSRSQGHYDSLAGALQVVVPRHYDSLAGALQVVMPTALTQQRLRSAITQQRFPQQREPVPASCRFWGGHASVLASCRSDFEVPHV